MPGILPMKVIKVGDNAQSRVAQACDRCRSKKIRCDGLRPSCSQCNSVGFQCKTSDKLSRRAFPRGYTESLEERVRTLETEVKELKDLLDAKEEKIDLLSRVRSNASHPSSPTARRASTNSSPPRREARHGYKNDQSEAIEAQSPSKVNGWMGYNAHSAGMSSARGLVDSFRFKLKQEGRPYPNCHVHRLFPLNRATPKSFATSNVKHIPEAPPRLMSDQLVNVFFQEWADLFPVLHHPTFLSLYERYITNEKSVVDRQSIALLNLVFGIAALSSDNLKEVNYCEARWISALESFITEASLINLQCLALAQIFCIQKGDYSKLLHYKTVALDISQQLGLHESQQPGACDPLTLEIRKRLFWTLYTLDGFSAALLGLPRFLQDDNISSEYPVDADDEYISESGFESTPPGESTKISSALALFRGSRVLCKVLDINYSAGSTSKITCESLDDLTAQLDEWYNGLAPKLKMIFEREKPSTRVISSAGPLMSLTYHYIRTLIHRPFVTIDDSDIASASIMAISTSSKSIIQIIQLLDERHLSFSHFFNKAELILVAGFGLMLQTTDLCQNSKLLQDTQRILCVVTSMLEQMGTIEAEIFKGIARVMFSARPNIMGDLSRRQYPHQASSDSSTPSNDSLSMRKGFMDIARRYTLAAGLPDSSKPPAAQQHSKRHRSTASSNLDYSPSQQSSTSSIVPKEENTHHITTKRGSSSSSSSSRTKPHINLDYFSFHDPQKPLTSRTPGQTIKPPQSKAEIENVLRNFEDARDQHQDNDLHPLYDWPSLDDLLDQSVLASTTEDATTASLLEGWSITAESDLAFNSSSNASLQSPMQDQPKQEQHSISGNQATKHHTGSSQVQSSTIKKKPNSLQSFSSDSLTSGGEEFSSISTLPSRDTVANADPDPDADLDVGAEFDDLFNDPFDVDVDVNAAAGHDKKIQSNAPTATA